MTIISSTIFLELSSYINFNIYFHNVTIKDAIDVRSWNCWRNTGRGKEDDYLILLILHDTGVTMRYKEAIAKRRRYHILDAAYNPPFKLYIYMGGLFLRYYITCNSDSPNEFYLTWRRLNKAYVVLNLYFCNWIWWN